MSAGLLSGLTFLPERSPSSALGISHSVISIPPEDENFLRLNFYTKVRWRVPIDPTKHYFDSRFELKTTVHKQAEWRKNQDHLYLRLVPIGLFVIDNVTSPAFKPSSEPCRKQSANRLRAPANFQRRSHAGSAEASGDRARG
jgi:hypothetical protein